MSVLTINFQSLLSDGFIHEGTGFSFISSNVESLPQGLATPFRYTEDEDLANSNTIWWTRDRNLTGSEAYASGFRSNFQDLISERPNTINSLGVDHTFNGSIWTLFTLEGGELTIFKSLQTDFNNEDVGIQINNDVVLVNSNFVESSFTSDNCAFSDLQLFFNIGIESVSYQGNTIFPNGLLDVLLTSIPRGQIIPFDVFSIRESVDQPTNRLQFSLRTPDRLRSEHLTINTTTTNTGVTVEVLVQFQEGLILEYSIDGVNYSVNNFFFNLEQGSTVLIRARDQLGCELSKSFLLPSAGITIPISLYPIDNPIIHTKETINEIHNKSLIFRRSDKQPYAKINHKVQHKYIYDDIIQEELHSNFTTNLIEVLDCKENVIDTLTITKLSDFINKQERAQARLYQKFTGKIWGLLFYWWLYFRL